MDFTDVRINLNKGGRVKAFVQVIIDGCFLVGDIRVLEGKEGTVTVAMPSRRLRNGSFRDIVHPLNTDTRRKLEGAVIDAYERTLAEHGDPSATDNGRSRGQELTSKFLSEEYWTSDAAADE
jgi:stage V sporulation protein G